MNKTCESIVKTLPRRDPVELEKPNLTLMCKMGFDGSSGHSAYKQKTEGTSFEGILLVHMESNLLTKDQEYPLPPHPETVERYFEISSVHTKILGQHLLFVLQIPLISTEHFTLIHHLPLPFAESYPSQIFHYISPQAPFLFTNAAVDRYAYLPDDRKCKLLSTELYICCISTLQRFTKPNCELQLLQLQHGYCNVLSMPAVEEIWEQIGSNNWVFVLNNRETLTLSCPGAPDTMTLLPNSGFLTLKTGCSASTRTVDLHTKSATSMYVSAHIAVLNISILKITLLPNFEFQPLHLQYIDLVQFKQMSLRLKEANRDILTKFVPIQQKHFNWTLLIIQIFLLFSLIF